MMRLVNGEFRRRPISMRRLIAFGVLTVFNCAVWYTLGWITARYW